jgi:hypothetical protein
MHASEQRRLVFHGAIVLLAGLLCGIPQANAITGGADPARIHAWQVAHNAIILAGIMQIAIASALSLARSAQTVRLIVWTLVAAGYGSIVGLALAAASGYRGLTPEGPALNLIAFACNLVVAVGSLAALPLLVWAMRGGRGTS